MMPRATVRVATVVGLAASGVPAHRLAAQARSAMPGSWTEIARVDDTKGYVFLKPELIAVSGDAVLVFDNGTQALASFSFQGDRHWSFGQRGSGPGEFSLAVDLAPDGRGGAYVLDPSNARITHVTAEGKLGTMISGIKQLHRIKAMADGRIMGGPLNGPLIGAVQPDGSLSAVAAAPSDIAGLSPLVRENYIAVAGADRLVLAHRWSTVALVVEVNARSVRSFNLIDPLPFPEVRAYKGGPGGQYTITRIDPKAIPVTRALAVSGETLYVVDARTLKQSPMIDEYDVARGTYIRSRPSPDRVRGFAVVGDELFGIVDDPLPALVIWHWSHPERQR